MLFLNRGSGETRAPIFFALALAFLAQATGPAHAGPQAGPGPRRAPKPAERLGREAPIAFRMDRLRADASREFEGAGHVLVRQGPWLICCDTVAGATDARGAVVRLTCRGHVRALHGARRLWAEEATFVAQTNALTLTGHPKVTEGESLMEGQRIVLDLSGQDLTIEAPTGLLARRTLEAGDRAPAHRPGASLEAQDGAPTPSGALPPLGDRCPLPLEPPSS